jgi:hypothetical protein
VAVCGQRDAKGLLKKYCANKAQLEQKTAKYNDSNANRNTVISKDVCLNWNW